MKKSMKKKTETQAPAPVQEEAVVREKKLPQWFVPLCCSIISGTAFSKFMTISTTNVFTLVLLILLYPMFKAALQIKERRICLTSAVCSIFYTGALFLIRLESLLSIDRAGYALYVEIAYLVGFYLFFRYMVALLYKKLLDKDLRRADPDQRDMSFKRRSIVFFSCMFCILAAWFPFFLREFPGDVTGDSHDQMVQFTGTGGYSAHHPLIHTMTIRLFYSLGMFLFGGNQNYAVATYSVCQAILLAAAFAYMLVTLYECRAKRSVLLTILAIYALLPFHAIYSITMWKDIWFGGMVVVVTTTLWRLVRHYGNGKTNKKPIFEWIMLFIFGLGMCLYRSNGLYVYILLIPCIAWIFRKKSVLTIVLSVLILPVVMVVQGPVYSSIGDTSADPIEALSIPAQHIAGAITNGAVLTDEEYALLSKVVNIEKIPETYRSHIADPIKALVRETDPEQTYLKEHKGDLLKLWFSLGVRYPKEYIIAQVNQTHGYWYPDVQNWIYAGQFCGTGEGLDIQQKSRLPEGLHNFYTYLMNMYKDVTYLGLFWSIGMYTWVCVFMLGLSFIKRNGSRLLVYVPVFAVLATLIIATPVFAEFRYAYGVYATAPLLCVLPFLPVSGSVPAAQEPIPAESGKKKQK